MRVAEPSSTASSVTAVEKLDLATEFVAKRGELPQAFKDRERIYVVPRDDLEVADAALRGLSDGKGMALSVDRGDAG